MGTRSGARPAEKPGRRRRRSANAGARRRERGHDLGRETDDAPTRHPDDAAATTRARRRGGNDAEEPRATLGEMLRAWMARHGKRGAGNAAKDAHTGNEGAQLKQRREEPERKLVICKTCTPVGG